MDGARWELDQHHYTTVRSGPKDEGRTTTEPVLDVVRYRLCLRTEDGDSMDMDLLCVTGERRTLLEAELAAMGAM